MDCEQVSSGSPAWRIRSSMPAARSARRRSRASSAVRAPASRFFSAASSARAVFSAALYAPSTDKAFHHMPWHCSQITLTHAGVQPTARRPACG